MKKKITALLLVLGMLVSFNVYASDDVQKDPKSTIVFTDNGEPKNPEAVQELLDKGVIVVVEDAKLNEQNLQPKQK
jgi:rRNA pseudouridine-1189 N-methylase Emg1 (Nep1/Mra1 family)